MARCGWQRADVFDQFAQNAPTRRIVVRVRAEVTLAVRRLDAGERVAANIRGVAPYAIDPSNAERLWNVALKLVS
jgi:hypothetical protein